MTELLGISFRCVASDDKVCAFSAIEAKFGTMYTDSGSIDGFFTIERCPGCGGTHEVVVKGA